MRSNCGTRSDARNESMSADPHHYGTSMVVTSAAGDFYGLLTWSGAALRT